METGSSISRGAATMSNPDSDLPADKTESAALSCPSITSRI
jgi:hypothetical protein